MPNGRKGGKRGDSGRDPGGFVALPWTVLDSPAFAALSYPARALLLEFARQVGRDNNGKLLASTAYLGKRGWKSHDVVTRALRDLIDAGFVHQTVQGHRPNKASWFAVTWRVLDRLPGYDVGAVETFERGAYRKNASLIPAGGIDSRAIVPSRGIEKPPPIPSPGTINPHFGHLSIPSRGNHLEKPSPAAIN